MDFPLLNPDSLRKSLVNASAFPVLVGIAGSTYGAGKSTISERIVAGLRSNRAGLDVITIETSSPISRLLALMRSWIGCNRVWNTYSDLNKREVTRYLVLDWLPAGLYTPESKEIGEFSSWLAQNMEVFLERDLSVPLLQVVSEEEKAALRKPVYQPCAQQISRCFGAGSLLMLSLHYHLRPLGILPNVVIVGGIRLLEDVAMLNKFSGLILKISSSTDAVRSRYACKGLTWDQDSYDSGWDSQVADEHCTTIISNEYHPRLSPECMAVALQQTDQAVNDSVRRILEKCF